MHYCMHVPVNPQMIMVDAIENATVEVVNVVMNNMENYLPSDVNKEEEEM